MVNSINLSSILDVPAKVFDTVFIDPTVNALASQTSQQTDVVRRWVDTSMQSGLTRREVAHLGRECLVQFADTADKIDRTDALVKRIVEDNTYVARNALRRLTGNFVTDAEAAIEVRSRALIECGSAVRVAVNMEDRAGNIALASFRQNNPRTFFDKAGLYLRETFRPTSRIDVAIRNSALRKGVLTEMSFDFTRLAVSLPVAIGLNVAVLALTGTFSKDLTTQDYVLIGGNILLSTALSFTPLGITGTMICSVVGDAALRMLVEEFSAQIF